MIELGVGKSANRLRKGPRTSSEAGAQLNPAARKALSDLVARLATVTPAERQRAVASLVPALSGATLVMVIDAVVADMLWAPEPARSALADALVEIGPTVAPSVALALIRAKREPERYVTLAGVLERVGPHLPPGEERAELLSILDMLTTKVVGAEAVAAVERAVAAVLAAIRLHLASAEGRP